jgi:hypothetical protein
MRSVGRNDRPTLTFEVKLADDAAVDAGTLDGNDVRVTGPNGFARAATFAGANVGTSGAQRVARYTVDIAGYPADPALYVATLNAGQIADVAGNFAAGGTLGFGRGRARRSPTGPGPRCTSPSTWARSTTPAGGWPTRCRRSTRRTTTGSRSTRPRR